MPRKYGLDILQGQKASSRFFGRSFVTNKSAADSRHAVRRRADWPSLLEAMRSPWNISCPHVVKSPPDAMRGQFLKFSEDEARVWLDDELDRVFPKAEALIEKMQLNVRYKDVTIETLSQKDFLDAVKESFPKIDWDKAYNEFPAAGEKDGYRWPTRNSIR